MGTAFSLTYFVLTGFNCLWQNTAIDVWGFSPESAAYVLLGINATAGTSGMVFGTKIVARNFEGLSGRDARSYACLEVLTRWTLICAISASAGSAFLFFKAHKLIYLNTDQPATLGVIWVMMILFLCIIVFVLNSIQGFLAVECNLDGDLSELATGTRVLVQNLLGYGLGAYSPGLVISI